MGRKKGYDREVVLSQAMRLFWERGFHATTTRELTEGMGLNVYSLYAEFGSKEGLFEAALDRYDRTVVEGHFAGLEAPGAGLEAVAAVLRFFGEAAAGGNPLLGCLMANAMTEQAPTGPSSRQRGAEYTRRLSRAFEAALAHAQRAGALQPEAPVAELAQLLTVALLGVFVLLRAGGEPEVMRAATAQAWARVEGFAVKPGSGAAVGPPVERA
jgi:TetR/AcrR family transcriptional repressor of nem operon